MREASSQGCGLATTPGAVAATHLTHGSLQGLPRKQVQLCNCRRVTVLCKMGLTLSICRWEQAHPQDLRTVEECSTVILDLFSFVGGGAGTESRGR